MANVFLSILISRYPVFSPAARGKLSLTLLSRVRFPGGRLKAIASSAIPLGIGEGFARLCNLLTAIVISHRLGVGALGAFALAQTISTYLLQAIDMGMRHIGARLIANYPGKTKFISRLIQCKRLIMALLFVPVAFLYGMVGPVPADARLLVAGFSVSMLPYAFSLDWVAWGAQRYGWLGGFRATNSIVLLIAAIFGSFHQSSFALWITAGNAIGYIIGSLVLRLLVFRTFAGAESKETFEEQSIRKEANWNAIFWMGFALTCNQTFNNIDSLLLGGMANTHEVGLYNAAYRLVSSTLATYYLATQTVFPHLAMMSRDKHSLRTLQKPLLIIIPSGLAIAVAFLAFRSFLITVLYGERFTGAVILFTVLVWAIPMDFVTSFIGNAMVAWGLSRRVLIATSSAALANILLNLYCIPHFGAMGAAWTTLFSYVVLLGTMLISLQRRDRKEELSILTEPGN